MSGKSCFDRGICPHYPKGCPKGGCRILEQPRTNVTYVLDEDGNAIEVPVVTTTVAASFASQLSEVSAEPLDVAAWARCHLTMAVDTECVRATDDDGGPGCGACLDETLAGLRTLHERVARLTGEQREPNATVAYVDDHHGNHKALMLVYLDQHGMQPDGNFLPPADSIYVNGWTKNPPADGERIHVSITTLGSEERPLADAACI